MPHSYHRGCTSRRAVDGGRRHYAVSAVGEASRVVHSSIDSLVASRRRSSALKRTLQPQRTCDGASWTGRWTNAPTRRPTAPTHVGLGQPLGFWWAHPHSYSWVSRAPALCVFSVGGLTLGGTDVPQAPTCHPGRPPPRPCNKPMCHTATTEGAHHAERSMGGGDTMRSLP